MRRSRGRQAGLLSFVEVADMLGVRTTDALDLMGRGAIDSVRLDGRPYATEEAVRSYQQKPRR